MPIKTWPSGERPREKLLHLGAETLSDAELLALFIVCGPRGKSALDVARDALSHFAGLRGLLEAKRQDFCGLPGLGEAKYCLLQAALELSRRHLQTTLQRDTVFDSPRATRDFLVMRLRHQPREVFVGLFLTAQHALIKYEPLFYGSISVASVYPREVVRRALELGAAAIIVAHNHPSGVAEPSRADERITQQLKEALALIDVRLLDHCVVGEADVVSLAERGLC
ncbi:MAG TPA: DNA repair protein RadC [Pseudomonadales bacterium]|nr:DNA repair protein RadC [Pseudomonadales bacterium]